VFACAALRITIHAKALICLLNVGETCPIGVVISINYRSGVLKEQRSDRRATATRTSIDHGAWLFFGEQRPVFDCVVRDISESGAKIALDRLYALPKDFLLSFDNFATAKNCRFVWMQGNFVGVKFQPAVLPVDL
jgi:PilZ domain